MNELSTTAAAVKDLIAEAEIPTAEPQDFSVVRCFVVPEYDTAARDDLQVIVIAFEEEVDLFGPNTTRQECDHVLGVMVSMVKRVAAADVSSAAALNELDALSDFREGLIDLLKSNPGMGNATLESLKNKPAVYDVKLLEEKKVFVSVIALTYRLTR